MSLKEIGYLLPHYKSREVFRSKNLKELHYEKRQRLRHWRMECEVVTTVVEKP